MTDTARLSAAHGRIKYAIRPGMVISRTDADRHFITALQLANLYGVNLNECRVLGERDRAREGEVVLAPRFDGQYKKVER
jgi:hypothetical protein